MLPAPFLPGPDRNFPPTSLATHTTTFTVVVSGSMCLALSPRFSPNPRADSVSTHLISLLFRDDYDAAAAAELKRKRTFRKFTYRGIELDALLDMSNEDFMSLVHARARRKFQRGLKRKPMGLIKRLRKAKAECQPNEKPATVKTHLRDMIVVPEMIGSMIGIYTGRFFVNTEIKPEMVGHYLGEFAMTYIPTRHGAKGKGATVDRFLPIR